MVTSSILLKCQNDSCYAVRAYSISEGAQLARGHSRCVDTGHLGLIKQLPGDGWPMDMMVHLRVQRPGIGEMRPLAPALAPALSKVYSGRIATL
jgi:hypothetical protein